MRDEKGMQNSNTQLCSPSITMFLGTSGELSPPARVWWHARFQVSTRSYPQPSTTRHCHLHNWHHPSPSSWTLWQHCYSWVNLHCLLFCKTHLSVQWNMLSRPLQIVERYMGGGPTPTSVGGNPPICFRDNLSPPTFFGGTTTHLQPDLGARSYLPSVLKGKPPISYFSHIFQGQPFITYLFCGTLLSPRRWPLILVETCWNQHSEVFF